MVVLGVLAFLFLFLFCMGLFACIISIYNNLNDFKDKVDKRLDRIMLKLPVEGSIQGDAVKPSAPTPSSIDDKPQPKEAVPVHSVHIEAQKPVIKPAENKIHQEDITPNLSNKSETMVKLFMGNIFNKIGAFAIIIGFVIFLKIVSGYITFTPIMKFTLAFLAGVLLMFTAYRMHGNKKYNSYSAVLMGTGLGVLYVTVFCSCTVFNFLSYPIASVCAILLLLISMFISEKIKMASVFIVAIVGVYLNLIIINYAENLNFASVFAYLFFANLVSIVYAFKNKDDIKLLYPVLVISPLFMFFHIFYTRMFGSDYTYLLFYPVIYCAMYFIYDIYKSFKGKNDIYLSWINLVILFAFYAITYIQDFKTLSICLMATAAFYLFVSYAARGKIDFLCFKYLNIGLFSILPSILVLQTDWLLKNSLFAGLGILLDYFYSKKGYNFLQNWAVAFLTASFVTIFRSSQAFFAEETASRFILNKRTLYYLIPSAASYISLHLWKNKPNYKYYALRLCALSCIYLYFATEINTFFNSAAKEAGGYLSRISNVILWCIYAVQIKCLSSSLKFKIFSYLSYVILYADVIWLLCMASAIHPAVYYPVFNPRTIAYLFIISAMLIFKKQTKFDFFGYSAVAFGFILLNLECFSFLDKINAEIRVLSTVMWLIYAGALMFAGIYANKNVMTKSGIVVAILALIKVFLYDTISLEPVSKVISYIFLGFILMLTSYLYLKFQKTK